MKTTAVVHSRGGGKGYLCLRHKLCFPNSAAANEEFSKRFSKTNFFTRHLVAININKIYKN